MDKKLTVFVVCDSFWPNIGGMEKVAEYSSNELSKKYNVVLFAPKINGYKDNFSFRVFRVKSIPIQKPNTLLALPKFDGKLKKFLKNNKPDVIHIHNLAGLSKWFAKYGKKHNIPTFLTLHGYVDNDVEAGTKIKCIRPIIRKMFFNTISLVDNLLTVSNGCKDYYTKLGYKDIKLLRNCNDIMIKDDKFSEEIKQTCNISESDNVLCFVNRLIAIKNVKLLIESLKFVKEQNVPYKMIIAGDGNERKNMENLVKEYGLSDNVFFLGNLTDRSKVASVYNLADLHLFPSVKDNLSLSIGESASQGTATLGMENCSTTECIVDNDNGFLSKNDAKRYAEKIVKILSDKSRLKSVGENAKNTLYRTWEDYVFEFEKIILSKIEDINNG